MQKRILGIVAQLQFNFRARRFKRRFASIGVPLGSRKLALEPAARQQGTGVPNQIIMFAVLKDSERTGGVAFIQQQTDPRRGDRSIRIVFLRKLIEELARLCRVSFLEFCPGPDQLKIIGGSGIGSDRAVDEFFFVVVSP